MPSVVFYIVILFKCYQIKYLVNLQFVFVILGFEIK